MWILLIVMFLNKGHSKVVYEKFTFTPESQWQYFTKFGTDIEPGSFKLQARFSYPFTSSQSHYELHIYFYLDYKWDLAIKEDTCTQKTSHYIRHEVIKLNSNGQWSNVKKAWLRQVKQPYVWFLAVADCENKLHTINPNMPPIDIYIILLGTDNTHFTYEEYYMLPLYTVSLIGYTIILGYNLYNYYKHGEIIEEIYNPMWLVLASVILEFISILTMWIHLLIYSKDGQGIIGLHTISIITETASQCFLSILLMLISWGWTINYLRFKRSLLLMQLLFTVLIIHLLLAGLTELGDNKHHNYDGIQGVLLVLIRLGMFMYFLCGFIKTYKGCSVQIKYFYKTFAIYSGAYLLSFPLLISICQFCVIYVRHRVMTVGTIFFHSLALCTLIHLFTNNNNQYTRISKYKAPLLSLNKLE